MNLIKFLGIANDNDAVISVPVRLIHDERISINEIALFCKISSAPRGCIVMYKELSDADKHSINKLVELSYIDSSIIKK